MSTTDAPTIPRHPAKWSAPILAAISDVLEATPAPPDPCVLDPFAGSGLGRLERAVLHGWPAAQVTGVELEPEWADAHQSCIAGDSRDLPAEWRGMFAAVISSASYGNRMADHHDARDACRACDGGAVVRSAVGELVPCKACDSTGLSRRNTYRHALGRPLTEGSGAGLQWGRDYRHLHEAVMRECLRVLEPGGLILWNVSNHIRDGREVLVAEWHLNTWLVLGAKMLEVRRIATRRQRQGANGDLRVDGELLLVLRAPA